MHHIAGVKVSVQPVILVRIRGIIYRKYSKI